ncbi:MAG TPA: hypothetical protein VFJ82_07895 [Longimicrobium sp.]|nr:hypothetical protein [Longimicrobium sp.]
MPLTPAGWRRLHASTRLAAVLGAFGALMLFAPLAYAVLMLRSSGASHGAEPGAWVVIGILVGVCAAAAGAMTALLVAAIRHLWLRTR